MSLSDRPKTVLGCLLIAQAMFVASTFRSWAPLTMVTVMVVLFVLLRHRSSVNKTQAIPAVSGAFKLPRAAIWLLTSIVIAVIIAVVVVWRVGGKLNESSNLILLGSDAMSHAAIFLSLGVWMLRPTRGHVSMLPLAMTLMMLCVVAGGVSRSIASQTTIGLAACIGFAIGSQVILSGKRSRNEGKRFRGETDSQAPSWTGPVFATLTLSLLLTVTSAVANVTDRALPGIQDDLRHQLQVSLDAVGNQSYIGGMRYVSGSQLGSIREHLTQSPQEVALRIFSVDSPGYLRGTVFDLYRSRRWYTSGDLVSERRNELPSVRDFSVPESGVGRTKLQRNQGRTLRRFSLLDAKTNATNGAGLAKELTLEIHNDPMKGQIVFLPLMTRWIEASGSDLIISRHGVVRLGIDLSHPYVAGVVAELPAETITEERREILMDVASDLRPAIESVTKEICDFDAPAKIKAAAISQFFQQEFEYGLNRTRAPRGTDPLLHFLDTRHVAHCEYFASATVLMLRSAGVPARYVTGYVADELSSDDDQLWYARNRDAHAWAEGFDDKTGKWFAVESTPGRAYQTIDPNRDYETDLGAQGAGDFWSTADNDSMLSRITTWLLSVRVTNSLFALFQIAQVLLLIAMIYFLWGRFLKRGGVAVDPIDQQSRKRLSLVDRRLRKWSLIRRNSETLYQFADRIVTDSVEHSESFSPDRRQAMQAAADWYRSYADARYQGKMPPAI